MGTQRILIRAKLLSIVGPNYDICRTHNVFKFWLNKLTFLKSQRSIQFIHNCPIFFIKISDDFFCFRQNERLFLALNKRIFGLVVVGLKKSCLMLFVVFLDYFSDFLKKFPITCLSISLSQPFFYSLACNVMHALNCS